MEAKLQNIIAQVREQIKEVSINQVKEHLEKYTIIDIREITELAKGMIPNASHIPRGLLEFVVTQAHNGAIKDGMPVLLYCQKGSRSVLAARSLEEIGYTEVYSLKGGYEEWAKQFPSQ